MSCYVNTLTKNVNVACVRRCRLRLTPAIRPKERLITQSQFLTKLVGFIPTEANAMRQLFW